MKKIKLLTISACAFSFLMNTQATDLSTDVKLNINDGMGNIITTTKSYDSSHDINRVNVVVNINEGLINHILNQTPGNPSSAASMGAYYMTFTPENMKGKTLHKESIWLNKGSDGVNEIATLDEKIKTADDSTTASFYPFGLRVEYFDGTNWIRVKNKSNGGLSIAQNLMNLLNLNSRDELKYGENFRFYMNEDKTLLIGWQNKNNESDKEYVLVSYDVKFSIAATTDAETYAYYPNLSSALSSGSKEIIVNENLKVNEDLTIPAGVTLKVAKNVKLEIGENVKINNLGHVASEGQIEGFVSANYEKIEELEQKVKELDETLYTLESLTNLKTALANITKDLSFADQDKVNEMANLLEKSLNDLKLVETNKPVDENKTPEENKPTEPSNSNNNLPENPKTADNIMLYVVTFLLAIIGLKFSTKYLKKHN